ncbi:putative RNA-binding protein 8A-like [Capsicum annuum]|nr:putative RNA-binding protein 8A-like [Capsicum annuum]
MENINNQQETKRVAHKELKKAKPKPPYEIALEIHTNEDQALWMKVIKEKYGEEDAWKTKVVSTMYGEVTGSSLGNSLWQKYKVTRSASVPPSTRDALYHGLPPSIKSALRFKLLSFSLKEELTVPQIKGEMEKTLQWLVPMAANTTKAHHGFGWVGEWANTGSDINRKPESPVDLRIETLYHADKEKTEAYILELVVWLHHLVSQSRRAANGGVKSPVKSPIRSPNQKMIKLSNHRSSSSSSPLTVEDQEMLCDVSKRKLTPGISKSQEFAKTGLSKYHRLSKSSSHSPVNETRKDPFPIKRPSSVPVVDFDTDRMKALDVIDRVDKIRVYKISEHKRSLDVAGAGPRQSDGRSAGRDDGVMMCSGSRIPAKDKLNITTMYLTGDTKSWWRIRNADDESAGCPKIDTWKKLKNEMRDQFLSSNASWIARDKLKRLRQHGTIREYIKEFTSLMLDIQNMSDEDKLHNFISGMQAWAQNELRRQNVKDLPSAIAVVESLVDFCSTCYDFDFPLLQS